MDERLEKLGGNLKASSFEEPDGETRWPMIKNHSARLVTGD